MKGIIEYISVNESSIKDSFNKQISKLHNSIVKNHNVAKKTSIKVNNREFNIIDVKLDNTKETYEIKISVNKTQTLEYIIECVKTLQKKGFSKDAIVNRLNGIGVDGKLILRVVEVFGYVVSLIPMSVKYKIFASALFKGAEKLLKKKDKHKYRNIIDITDIDLNAIKTIKIQEIDALYKYFNSKFGDI